MMEVRYGEIVQLTHRDTAKFLANINVPYNHPGSSGQAIIFAEHHGEPNTFWQIESPHGMGPMNGQPLTNGAIVTLRNTSTGLKLHSHDAVSPATRQHEVTGFGGNDMNDNFRVEIQAPVVTQGAQMRLIHVATNHALHSHGSKFFAPIGKEVQEVTCFNGRDDNDWWIVRGQAQQGFPGQMGGYPQQPMGQPMGGFPGQMGGYPQQPMGQPMGGFPGQPVGYGGLAIGSELTLEHCETKKFLACSAKQYNHPGSSGQNVVFAEHHDESHNPHCKWVIAPPFGVPAMGSIVNGSVISLRNQHSGMFLHSHNCPSPASGQHEVSGFGGQDINNNWIVEIGAPVFNKHVPFRLVHQATNHALHSHHVKFFDWERRERQEVSCFQGRDANDMWIAK